MRLALRAAAAVTVPDAYESTSGCQHPHWARVRAAGTGAAMSATSVSASIDLSVRGVNATLASSCASGCEFNYDSALTPLLAGAKMSTSGWSASISGACAARAGTHTHRGGRPLRAPPHATPYRLRMT